MFERYTEKTRRVIFFARYEASQYGSQYIDTEHLLLGLTRENFLLLSSAIGSEISADRIRQEIEKHMQRGERFSTALEVPLSIESRRVLKFAAEEAERLADRHVGTEHLLLGLLREENARAAVVLRQYGADAGEIRLKLAGNASRYREAATVVGSPRSYRVGSGPARSAMDTLDSFLCRLKSNTSPELVDFFAKDGQFIDTGGKVWIGRQEIKKDFERLFAAFSKKNTRYRVENTNSERLETVLASVLWENALHTEQTPRSVLRMTVVLVPERSAWGMVPEGNEWAIFLIQIAAVAR
jgi:Clp amino terminal domain, pathogenicity island component/SnoaL-like domain